MRGARQETALMTHGAMESAAPVMHGAKRSAAPMTYGPKKSAAPMTHGAMESAAPMKRRLILAGPLLLAAGLAACSERKPGWALYDIQGHVPDLDFTLSGAGGQPVSAAGLRGNFVLLFFGYTNCPDICPTTLAQLAEALRQLGDEARRFRIVFISVDPHRDTPEKMAAYTGAFSPQAIGLTGTPEQIAALAKRYRVSYQIEAPRPGAAADSYEVTHSRGVFIFDPKGRARLLSPDDESTDAFVADMRRLLAAPA
jgi:protein SCO1/2